jgi:hypothetical protein
MYSHPPVLRSRQPSQPVKSAETIIQSCEDVIYKFEAEHHETGYDERCRAEGKLKRPAGGFLCPAESRGEVMMVETTLHTIFMFL